MAYVYKSYIKILFLNFILFSGAWSRTIGQLAGVKVPLIAMKHAYVVTERIEGIRNMPNIRDHDASVYLKLQGDALSVGGYESNPIFWEEVLNKAFWHSSHVSGWQRMKIGWLFPYC